MGGAEYKLNPEFQSNTPYMVCPAYVFLQISGSIENRMKYCRRLEYDEIWFYGLTRCDTSGSRAVMLAN